MTTLMVQAGIAVAVCNKGSCQNQYGFEPSWDAAARDDAAAVLEQRAQHSVAAQARSDFAAAGLNSEATLIINKWPK
jgi:hypothetical protein